MSDHRLEFSAEAEADMQAILQYTEVTWGSEQAARYFADMRDALERVRAFPYSGKARSDVAPGLRSSLVKQHLILYGVTSDVVRIM